MKRKLDKQYEIDDKATKKLLNELDKKIESYKNELTCDATAYASSSTLSNNSGSVVGTGGTIVTDSTTGGGSIGAVGALAGTGNFFESYQNSYTNSPNLLVDASPSFQKSLEKVTEPTIYDVQVKTYNIQHYHGLLIYFPPGTIHRDSMISLIDIAHAKQLLPYVSLVAGRFDFGSTPTNMVNIISNPQQVGELTSYKSHSNEYGGVQVMGTIGEDITNAVLIAHEIKGAKIEEEKLEAQVNNTINVPKYKPTPIASGAPALPNIGSLANIGDVTMTSIPRHPNLSVSNELQLTDGDIGQGTTII
tara:strand:- start:582 stop:1496 length:915 start_codon:yes stop_codon:yes gene_type:complete